MQNANQHIQEAAFLYFLLRFNQQRIRCQILHLKTINFCRQEDYTPNSFFLKKEIQKTS